MQVTISVNGEEHTRDVEARLLLVHLLRDHLGLTGTHWGCDTSNCGACAVWLDDEPVKACTVLPARRRAPPRRGAARPPRGWGGGVAVLQHRPEADRVGPDAAQGGSAVRPR